eukprot:TRINITY_DN10271_c0_g2_i1.p1 TRINITY_DN10271_c0_g2~~TRINITY_DN10271_c0_g2_i1.p1  ORF type:complete len:160 (-),score=26.86 TRINITY_DN10271_c0_g2_i1:882-1361(-)
MSKAQREVELEVKGRLRRVEAKLSSQAIRANRVKAYIEEITSRLELVPSNEREAEQVISSLDELINDCTKDYHKDLQAASNELEIDGCIAEIKEPELDFKLVQAKHDKCKKELYSESVHIAEQQTSGARKNRSVATPMNPSSYFLKKPVPAASSTRPNT